MFRPLRASKSPMLTMPLSNRVYWGALKGVWELLREGTCTSSSTGLVGEELELALESVNTGGGSVAIGLGVGLRLRSEWRAGVDVEGARTRAGARLGTGGGMSLALVIFPVLVSCFI